LKVAAISHSCVIDVNQHIYAALLRRPDVDLLLVAPRSWTSSLRGTVAFSVLEPLAEVTRPLPVVFSGSIHLHWYQGLGDVLRAFKPDVLYADEEPYSLVTSQALAHRERLGCRFVFYTKQNLLQRYLPPFSWMQNRALAAADHAMAVSPAAREVLRHQGFEKGITELPHGVNAELLTPGRHGELRDRLGLQPPVIGYVGRIAGEKGVWDLLEAARLLAQRIGPTFRVLMVGDGPARWKLQEAAQKQLPPGVMCFVGSVAHHAIPDYLGVLDMLILPSRTRRTWKEQFGRVLVEALACGVPLVGSSSGHIPDLIRSTGGGLVFEEGNAGDLADKIQQMLGDPLAAQLMSEHGRKAALEVYAYPKVAEILHQGLLAALG
jgi:glycosyltransferase involved in cell wall biosynthesis